MGTLLDLDKEATILEKKQNYLYNKKFYSSLKKTKKKDFFEKSYWLASG